MQILYPETEFNTKDYKIKPLEFFNSDEFEKLKGNREVVLITGSYDIFHNNHQIWFDEIRRLFPEAILVCGVDSDEYVKSRKGNDRPYIPEDSRMGSVAFTNIDYVIKHDGDNELLLRTVKANKFMMSQATKEEPPITRINDITVCEDIDCDIVVLPAVSRYNLENGDRISTSAIEKKILYTHKRQQPQEQ